MPLYSVGLAFTFLPNECPLRRAAMVTESVRVATLTGNHPRQQRADFERRRQFEQIRLARRDDNASIRVLAARFGVHRRHVRAAVSSPIPPLLKAPVRASPVSRLWRVWITEILTADLDAPLSR
jgi:uncharacterized protein HemY